MWNAGAFISVWGGAFNLCRAVVHGMVGLRDGVAAQLTVLTGRPEKQLACTPSWMQAHGASWVVSNQGRRW